MPNDWAGRRADDERDGGGRHFHLVSVRALVGWPPKVLQLFQARMETPRNGDNIYTGERN